MLLTKGGKHGEGIESERNICTAFHGKLSYPWDVMTGQQTEAELRLNYDIYRSKMIKKGN
jgi:hypothetical protein